MVKHGTLFGLYYYPLCLLTLRVLAAIQPYSLPIFYSVLMYKISRLFTNAQLPSSAISIKIHQPLTPQKSFSGYFCYQGGGGALRLEGKINQDINLDLATMRAKTQSEILAKVNAGLPF